MERTASAFILTTREEGELPNREESTTLRPEPVGPEAPLPPAEEKVQDGGAARDASPASTVVMMDLTGSLDGIPNIITDFSDDEDVDVGDETGIRKILNDITGDVVKRGRERPITTGAYKRKCELEEERSRTQKEEDKSRRAEIALSSSLPKSRKWAKLLQAEKDLEDELSRAPTEDIAARMVEQSVKIQNCGLLQ